MTLQITVKQKEAKTVCFRYKGSYSLSGITCMFALKNKKSDTEYAISKSDTDFDKTEIADRKVKVKLSASDLDLSPGNYEGELKTTFTADNIDKSADIDFTVQRAVITD